MTRDRERAVRKPRYTRLNVRAIGSVSRQLEHGELAAKRRVVAQGRITADSAQAVGWVRQARRKTDARPAADAGENGDILLAAVLVGGDVADDAGRGLELVELLAG